VPGDTLPPTTAPVITAVLAPSTPATDEGVLFSQRLAVDSDPKGTNQTTYTVPAGQELHVTDIIMQNVNRDSGRATVLKGESIITQWDLSTSFDNNDPLQFYSGIVFEPGTVLTFKVDCDAPGTSGTCSEGLLVSGRLITL